MEGIREERLHNLDKQYFRNLVNCIRYKINDILYQYKCPIVKYINIKTILNL